MILEIEGTYIETNDILRIDSINRSLESSDFLVVFRNDSVLRFTYTAQELGRTAPHAASANINRLPESTRRQLGDMTYEIVGEVRDRLALMWSYQSQPNNIPRLRFNDTAETKHREFAQRNMPNPTASPFYQPDMSSSGYSKYEIKDEPV